jgi:glucose-6-phosphate isomerase
MAGRILSFGDMAIKPDVRMLDAMRDLLYDRPWAAAAADVPLYFMYRDAGMSEEHRELIRRSGLRYDVTVIPPLMLGVEYVKTAGHYHPLVQGQRLSYPELYYVLKGEAHYILQKAVRGRVMDVILIKAKEGDNVLIPPGYGHVTINPSSSELEMANWVCRDFSSVYRPYADRKGAAVYELAGGRLVANERYGRVPEVRFFKPTNFEEFGLKKNGEIYALVEHLEVLEYLKNPGKYRRLFDLLFTL